MTHIWIVETDDHECRLNTFLKKKLNGSFTAKEISWAIEHNGCQINGKLERFLSKRLQAKDKVAIQIAKRQAQTLEESAILYEDEYLVAYNKPAGIPTTGEKGLSQLLGFEAIHRLDRDTTGVVLFAKTQETLDTFIDLFRRKKIKKEYLAIVIGCPSAERGKIENLLGMISRREGEVTWGIVSRKNGLPSKTEWHMEKRGTRFSLLRCIPHTGRTHQIRIHLQSIGHPILGDAQYGTRRPEQNAMRPYLHAETIEFFHPFKKIKLKLQAPLPADFNTQIV